MTVQKRQCSGTHNKTHNNFRTLGAGASSPSIPSAASSASSARAARAASALSAVLAVFAVLVLGSTLLAFSCAPASDVVNVVGGGDGGGDGGGPSAPGIITDLSVDKSNIGDTSFTVQWAAPTETGTKPDGTALSSIELGYRIYYLVGDVIQTEAPSAESIRQSPDVSRLEVTGFFYTRIAALESGTRYFVTIASYNSFAQLETASSEVVEVVTGAGAGGSVLQVSTYHSNGQATDVLPVTLGQAIEDDSRFSLTNGDTVLTILDLTDGEHSIYFGTRVNSYETSYQKTAMNGTIQILKSEFATNSFSFTDEAVIGMSGPGIAGTLHIATYHPSNIYGHRDLQAMKKNLSGSYSLKNDIVLTRTSTGNYEAVGDNDNPFTGSLDGAGYTIAGVQIESTGNYQGLFGVIKVDTVDAVVARDLVLRDFKITGNAVVGSFAGWMKRGTIDNVHVEVSSADAGKVEVSGSVSVNGIDDSYGGGLLGYGGDVTGATDVQVRIRNTSSVATVSGTGMDSDAIGGLVGYINSNVMLTESYATGIVTGINTVGGLVAYNNGGTVIGYATGSVTGTGYNTGGLVGYNSGVVVGYATGSVSGGLDHTGGLVGYNGGVVTGYATGDVLGGDFVGGFVGGNAGGTVIGYARGIVRRGGGTDSSIGKTIGASGGATHTHMTYSSMSESQVYDGEMGTTALAGASGVAGTEVDIASATQMTFAGLTFGTALSKWTWVDGKWPAINIGEVKPAADQPIDPATR